jgi:arginyl-tRNA synthetase
MKSREGTVVDADDLIKEMKDTARTVSAELGKLEDYAEDERRCLKKIGLEHLSTLSLRLTLTRI